MVSRSETTALLARSPAFDDMFVSLNSAPKLPAGLVRETRQIVALARKFNDEVVPALYAGTGSDHARKSELSSP